MKLKLKSTLALLLALVLLLTAAVPAVAADDLPSGAVLVTKSDTIKADDFTIIAHRGLSACAPENTLAAFKLAGRSGCDGCEIDVQPTLDQRWVCFSDLNLSASTNGVGLVSAMTYDQISEYTITRGGNIQSYPNEKVPTLEEAVAVCQLYGMKVVLTVRNGVADQIDSLIATMKVLGVMKTATVISANHDILKKIQQNGGRAVYNATPLITLGAINNAKENGYVGLSTSTVLPGATLMNRVMDSKLELYPFDVDSLLKAEHMYNAGIKTVVSDCLVKHAPTPEKVSANILTTFTRIFNEIFNFFAKIFRKLSLDFLKSGLKSSLGV